MLDQSPEYQAAAFNVTLYASTSLAFMLADFVWLLADEIKYVWPRFSSSWNARIYVLARYGGLGSQIFSVYFAVRMYLGVYTTAAGCQRWFSFQAVVVQFLLGSVEGFLMQRIYALFLQSRIVLMIMVMFILGQIASMFISAQFSFPTNEYTVTCLLLRSNPGNAFFSTTTMTTNVVIFFMTFWRYFRLPAKWTQQGIGRVIFRDSVLTLSAISVMMFILTLSSLEVIKPRTSGNTIYYWLVGILWVSVGRIIVNCEKLRRDTSGKGEEEGSTWVATVQLTSQIEMGENTLTMEDRCRYGSSGWHTPSTSASRYSLSTTFAPATKGGQIASPSVSTNSDAPETKSRADEEMDDAAAPSRSSELLPTHGHLGTMSS